MNYWEKHHGKKHRHIKDKQIPAWVIVVETPGRRLRSAISQVPGGEAAREVGV